MMNLEKKNEDLKIRKKAILMIVSFSRINPKIFSSLLQVQAEIISKSFNIKLPDLDYSNDKNLLNNALILLDLLHEI